MRRSTTRQRVAAGMLLTVCAVVTVAMLVASGNAVAARPVAGAHPSSTVASSSSRATDRKESLPAGYTDDGSAANRVAARTDTERLLKDVRLPQGSKRLARRPSGDHGLLKGTKFSQHSVVVARDQWWTAQLSPSALMAYLKAHVPIHAQVSGTGSGGNSKTGATELQVQYAWPDVKDVLNNRNVWIIATTLANGKTGVLLESEADWFALRPLSDRISPSVEGLRIISKPTELGSTAKSRRTHRVVVDVSKRTELRKAVRLVDSFPVVQGDGYMCSLERADGNRTITLRFNSKSGKPAASLTYTSHYPLREPSGNCTTVQLTIKGKHHVSLVGGYFVRKLQKIVGKTLL